MFREWLQPILRDFVAGPVIARRFPFPSLPADPSPVAAAF
jgi:hypothetical protein